MQKKELKEKATHGNIRFPLACYKWDIDKEFLVKLHWHNETELIFLESGIFTVIINMKEYKINSPAFIFINSEDIHSIVSKNPCRESAVVFNLNMLSFEYFDDIQYEIIRPLIEKRVKFPKFIFCEDNNFILIKEIYLKILSFSKHNKLSSYLMVKSYIYQLIAFLYENKLFNNSNNISKNIDIKITNIKKILSYIHENYNRTISTIDMANMLQLNSQYFCRYFKKSTGKTPTEYINEIRIEKAAEYLSKTEMKIIDIAICCGYENISYFIKRFQKQKHMTPSKYRIEYKKSK